MPEYYDKQNYSKADLNEMAYEIVGAAIEVHKYLGPGLLESVYEECLVKELKDRSLDVDRQLKIPINYKGTILRESLRLDILVNNVMIVETKAVTKLLPVHTAQLISYLKLSAMPKGILINFNTDNIARSTIHKVSEYFRLHPD